MKAATVKPPEHTGVDEGRDEPTIGVTMRLIAQDVMSADPICVEPATTLRQLARTFAANDISGAPVVDAQGRVVGSVSKTDLIRCCVQGVGDLPPGFLFEMLAETGSEGVEVETESSVRVEEFMAGDPVTVTRETPLREVARQMCEGRIHRVIVVDEQRFPVGIITTLDLASALAG